MNDERRDAILADYEQELLSGRVFRNHALSQRGRYTDWVVCDRESWSHCVETLGRVAGESDALAQIASHILASGLPLYQTRHEAAAKVYELAADALAKGYDDVVRMAGPEPGRRSDNHRDFTLNERIALVFWLEEATCKLDLGGAIGVGWCADALRERYNVRLPKLPELDRAKQRMSGR